MKYNLNYFWRLFATGFAFVLFAIGAAIIYLTLLPAIVLTSNRTQRIHRIRSMVHYAFKTFLKILALLGLLKITTKDLEKFNSLRGCLLICNHPSLLDVLIIISCLNNIQCVVKKEVWKNPLVSGIVSAAGYIRNDIPPEEFLARCKQELAQGENILIFPEGTRTVPGQPIKLLRGLGNLALAAHADIAALVLTCEPATLYKGQHWYQIPAKRVLFQLQAGCVFFNADYENDSPRSIRVRALMRDIQHYYEKNLCKN